LILLILHFQKDTNLLFLIPIFLFWSLSIFWGSYNINSNFYFNSISKIPENSNNFAITFDDGPNEIITPKILELLEKYDQKASFFVIGNSAEQNIELLKTINSKGHTIGNHSFSHSNFFPTFSTKKVMEEIAKTNKIIESVTLSENIFFRPPFGVTNPNIAKVLKNLKMQSIAWNIRSLDTVKSENEVFERIKNVKTGDIILFHDNKENTPVILEKFLRLCNEKQLKSVSLNKILN
jgi:peptidoglycan/xylan/chitin deacetylase (PgdA/CDA1 family)